MRTKPLLGLAALLLCHCTTAENLDERFQAAAVEPGGGNVVPGWTWMGFRWSNNVVPFVIDTDNSWPWPAGCANPPPDDGLTMPTDQIAAINDAIEELRALTPVQFQPYTKTSPPPSSAPYLVYRRSATSGMDSIRGMPTDGCPNWIVVSTASGGQEMRRLALHETLHTLGMDHEQQRADRDRFVVFDQTCMLSAFVGTDSITRLWGIDTAGLLITPYDFDSIMEYGSGNSCDSSCALPGGGCSTPILSKLDGSTFGTPAELSRHDLNAIYRMYEAPLNPTDAPNSQLGTALAKGDFDGDGYEDLAVGVPGQNAVYLYKGTGGAAADLLGRLVAWRKLDFSSLPAGVVQTQQFGYSLASGDFDGDGKDDLAIGAPGDSTEQGAVYIFLQGKVSLSPLRSLAFGQRADEKTLTGVSGEADDKLGASLAVGDFDQDGAIDLAIGVPRKLISGVHSGEVLVTTPQRSTPATRLTPDRVPSGSNLEGARFGAHLLAADLNPDQDLTLDLLVGSPENAAAGTASGAVYVFSGGSTGLAGKQLLRGNLSHAAPQTMEFGAALSVGNFYGATTAGGHTERAIAVGAPFFNGSIVTGTVARTIDAAGAVFLFRPTSTSVSFAQTDVVAESAPVAGDHFGSALVSTKDVLYSSGNDVLWTGAPGAGSGNAFVMAHGTSGWGVNSFLPLPQDGTAQRIGAALVMGNFAPNSVGQAGDLELVVGAPGFLGESGAFYIVNFDQIRNGLFAVDDYQQTTANHE